MYASYGACGGENLHPFRKLEASPASREPCRDYGDPVAAMTNGRRFSRFLSGFAWYNPHGYDQHQHPGEGPSLDKAWAHWEHNILPRRHDTNGLRAQAGEHTQPTSLYSLWKTPPSQIPSMSVRLYFTTLLLLTVFLVGLSMMQAPLLLYFASTTYDPSNSESESSLEGLQMRGSAVCRSTEWVLCEDCQGAQSFSSPIPSYRIDDSNQDQIFVLKNTCNVDEPMYIPGLISYVASMLFLLGFGIVFYGLQRHAEVVFDEELQSTQDYAIKITNPPPDALDPHEWYHFLNQYSLLHHSPEKWTSKEQHKPRQQQLQGVRMITIAINNAKLVQTLVQRRKKWKQLKRLLKQHQQQVMGGDIDNSKNTNMDDMSCELSFDLNALRRLVDQTVHCISQAQQEAPWYRRLPSCFSDPANQPCRLFQELQQLDQSIVSQAMEENYKAVAIFAIFETERAQRNALHVLSTGKYNVWFNRLDPNKTLSKLSIREPSQSSRMDPKQMMQQSPLQAWLLPRNSITGTDYYLSKTDEMWLHLSSKEDENQQEFLQLLKFRGQKVLHVKEAPESNDVRWKDLQVSGNLRAAQFAWSLIEWCLFLMASGFAISWLHQRDLKDNTNEEGFSYAAIYITITNILVPKRDLAKKSLYFKIALFRWFNSAICLHIITPNVETISVVVKGETIYDRSLPGAVYPIIFAELFTIPILRMCDFMGNIRKHILAPRATDQEDMNACFIGQKVELAERYTDATKVLFVALLYAAILPEAYFLGALALIVQFAVAHFGYYRLWRPVPDIGPLLSQWSRTFFFSTALIVHVVMTAYFWSGYPFDNLCSDGDQSYKYCSQAMLRSGIFPPLPRFQEWTEGGSTWMTPSQAKLTSLYGWSSLVLVIAAALIGLYKVAFPFVQSIFHSTYEANGEDQGIPFSSVMHRPEASAYVPHVKEKGFPYPLLACEIKATKDHGDGDGKITSQSEHVLMNEDLIGWRDPFRGYDPHNLVHDLRKILGERKPPQPVFSIVQYWPCTT